MWTQQYDHNDGEYNYLTFDGTGGSESPYTRIVAFGKGVKDNFEIFDIQYIRPVFDGESSKHLELSNPFAIVHLDPDNKVLDTTGSGTQVVSSKISFFDGNNNTNCDAEKLQLAEG